MMHNIVCCVGYSIAYLTCSAVQSVIPAYYHRKVCLYDEGDRDGDQFS